jgi:Xaa-Pro aminopeptidase
MRGEHGPDMHPERLDRMRARIREADVAAAVLVHPPNLRYLVGFHSNAYSRPLTLIVPAGGDPTLLVPRLEELQAREMTGVNDVRSYVEWDEGSAAGGRLDAEWRALLADALRERGLADARLGLERAVLTGGGEAGLAAALPKVAWSDASGWVERLRLVKSPTEVEHHRRAGELAAAGLDAGFAAARAGATELEIKGASIAAVFNEGARRCRALAVASAGNALVGERIAAVHAPAGGRQAKPGDPVFVVLSASVEGAHCELSRTIVVGDAPTETQREWFRSVARAHEAARRRAVPGASASELDRAARRALREDGLAEYLPMRTGHGLGLAPVEAPNLGAGDETALQPGMVISIEPGVCIPGVGGALWADNYVVTPAGVDPLTQYPIEVT